MIPFQSLKTIGAVAFAVIAVISVYDGFADEMDFPSLVVILISAVCAIGFALAAWVGDRE